MPAHVKKRLAIFPFQRADIATTLRGIAGVSGSIPVADMLTRHVNRGKSTRKLVQRSIVIQD